MNFDPRFGWTTVSLKANEPNYLQNDVAELTVLSQGVQLLEQKAVMIFVLVNKGFRSVLCSQLHFEFHSRARQIEAGAGASG